MSGPLDGLTVIEMGSLIAGPFCGQLMGDIGADVIKIEAPGDGDPMRQWGQGAKPAWWRVIGRNKRSLALDLRQARGQEIARQLAAKADILIENFRPGTLEKWGMSPEVLHAINPRLIIVRVSGYGQTGPYADRAGRVLDGRKSRFETRGRLGSERAAAAEGRLRRVAGDGPGAVGGRAA